MRRCGYSPKGKAIIMKKIISFGPLLIILAAILWSADGLLRRSLFSLSPIIIVFYEHAFGFLVLLPLLLRNIGVVRGIQRNTWGAFAWVTLLSSVLGTLFYTAALGKIQYIQFSVVVLLQQTQPLFVVLFARLILKERLHPKYFFWLMCALGAVYLISFPQLMINWQTGQNTITASVLALSAAFAWGSSTAFSRYALLQVPALLATGVRFGLAAVLALVGVFLLGQQAQLQVLSPQQLTTLIVITFSTGMVALAIYYTGLKRTSAHIAAICELAWPLSAIVIDYVYFHRGLALTQWLGAGMLIVAIYQVTKIRKYYESS